MRSSCERASAVERAPLRDDVPRGAARDRADVRGRLVVDAPEPAFRDRARRGRDRRAALLRVHAGVRRRGRGSATWTTRCVGAPRTISPDRRRLVVDVPELARARRVWSNASAPSSPTSSFGVNRSSTPACGRFSRRIVAAASSIAATGGLVVGAEDRPGPRCGRCRPRRPARSAPRAGPCRGARRGRAARPRRSSPGSRAEQVAGRRADRPRPASSSSTSSAESREVAGDAVGGGPLLAPAGSAARQARGRGRARARTVWPDTAASGTFIYRNLPYAKGF